MKSISVIVPLYNECQSLSELYEEILAAVTAISSDYECIFVDDGSTDGSFQVLRRLQEKDSHVKIVRLRRNFGKSAALSAGFRLATGEIIVTLDADLQDCPAEISKLVKRLDEGCDLVSGWKQRRQDPLSKRWPSRLFNFLTSRLTGVPLHDINCGLKAYRHRVIEEIKVYGEMHRYIPVLASYRGFLVSEVPVKHRPRRYGKSKFGIGRLGGGFFDLLTVIMLTRYNSKPLHVFGVLGGGLLAAGFLIEIYLTVGWFLGHYIEDRPLFMAGILLLIIGVQFIFFGLMAEMIAYSSRREDEYSIREVLVVGADEVKKAVPAPLRR
ncbi:MAG: glycosyltransferase family 2 protein [Acidobacteriota bacterium]